MLYPFSLTTPPSSCRVFTCSIKPEAPTNTSSTSKTPLWPFQELLPYRSCVCNSISLKPEILERIKFCCSKHLASHLSLETGNQPSVSTAQRYGIEPVRTSLCQYLLEKPLAHGLPPSAQLPGDPLRADSICLVCPVGSSSELIFRLMKG